MAILNKASLRSQIADPLGRKTEVVNESNTHRANNVNTDILLVKTASKQWVIPNEKLEVALTFTNNADVDITNLSIQDTLGSDAEFVVGSVKVGGVAREELNPIEGCNLDVTVGGLGGEVTMSYEIIAADVPTQYAFKNSSQVTFALGGQEFALNSNEVEVTILGNEVWLTKTANVNAVKQGDTLTYTITIENAGTLDNTDLVFTDQVPEGTTFVPSSVKIDGVTFAGYNPNNGFNLPDLKAGESTTVEFSVTVD